MIAKNLWILGPKKDLFFIIGCCILTPLSFLTYSLLTPLESRFHLSEGTVAIVIWAVFDGLFDSPHIFRTFARTHKDKTEWLRHRWLHSMGLIGLILLGMLLVHLEYSGELYFVVAVIGSWHIFKQNVGFLKVYNAKAKLSQWERKIDLYFFYSLYFYYLTAYLKNDQIPVWKDLKNHIGEYSFYLETIALYAFLFMSLLFLINLFKNLKTRSYDLLPKLLFLSSIALTYLFIRQIIPICPLIIIIVAETIYHDVQYQAWMNFYQEKRFQETMPFFNKWFVLSLLYGLVFLLIDLVLGNMGYVATLGFMIILYHYIVDGFIWKFSSQPELKSLF